MEELVDFIAERNSVYLVDIVAIDENGGVQARCQGHQSFCPFFKIASQVIFRRAEK